MAVNESRSMNADLAEGISDGIVKKLAPNRGGYLIDTMLAQNVYNSLHTELYDPAFSGGRASDAARRLTTLHV